MLDLDPARTAAEPRDAATVVVLRAVPDGGVECFCVERHVKSGFLGGAVVFPGGKVDPDDHQDAWGSLTSPMSPRARSLAPEECDARAFAVAALRELLEEAALVPVVGDGLTGREALELRARWERERVVRDSPGFAQFIRRATLVIDVGRLVVMSRWITPVAEKRRFDARFFVLALPPGQTGSHDRRETTRCFWAPPADVLARWARDEVMLAPPTVRTLQLLAPARSIDAAFSIARRQSLEPTCPHFTMDAGASILTLPGDPLHPTRRPPPDDPDSPTRFVLEGRRFVPHRAT